MDLVFYFQVHQPYRLHRFRRGDVGVGKPWFDDRENRRIVERVAERCYLPMNELVLDQIERNEGRFRCAYSLSGTALQQFRDWVPEVVDSFVALAESGGVEFLCETSQHSLASVEDEGEFCAQVLGHRAVIEDQFGQKPTTFRNTELVIDNDVGRMVHAMGFDTLLGEGADRLLGGRNPRVPYRLQGAEGLSLLLRDYLFSDDIAFRFSNRDWESYPLFAETFVEWLGGRPKDSQFVGLFMDYETFGEHQWADTGIFDFMRALPGFVLDKPELGFATPSEVTAASAGADVEILDIPGPVSWADEERDLTAWLGNPMQEAAHRALYDLLPRVQASGDAALMADWRRLSTSDHVYYMCTKYFSDGDVHEYFSPCESPHDAFVRFMFVLDDMRARLAGERAPAAKADGTRSSKPPKKQKRHR